MHSEHVRHVQESRHASMRVNAVFQHMKSIINRELLVFTSLRKKKNHVTGRARKGDKMTQQQVQQIQYYYHFIIY